MGSATPLFDRADEQEAQAAAKAAEEARKQALRRARIAPHGEAGLSRQRVREATAAALAAELVLQRVRDGR